MIDARLALPAVAAWLGAIAVQVASGQMAASMVDASIRRGVIGWGSLALVAACLPWITGWLPRSQAGRSAPVASIALGMAVGVASAAIMVVTLAADPVASWTQSRATATVHGVISGDPVTRSRVGAAVWQGTSMIEMRMNTASVAARGEQVEVALPIVLRIVGEASGRARPVGGMASSLPTVGTFVEVTGRLSPSRAPGMAGTLTVLDVGDIAIRAEAGWLDAIANAMRSGLQASVAAVDPGAGALVAGLAVGDESLLPPSLETAMRDSGLSHLTAVSGGNVAVIVVVVMGLARLAGLRIRTRVLICLVALVCFVILVRPQPSVLRASVMGAVVLLGMLGGGRGRGVGVLSTTILLLVAISPALAVSWGFALSVAATAGLILLGPVLQEYLATWRFSRIWPPGWRDALAITLAAQLATLPLLVGMGSQVGWAAIPANLLAMPAVPAVTILGLLASLISPILPSVASLIAHGAALPAAWIAQVATVCSELPAATLPWPAGWVGIAALGAVGGLAWLSARRLRSVFPQGVPMRLRITTLAVAAAGFIAITMAPPSMRGWPPDGWLLVACDVGQGDGLVVSVEADTAIVVDVGPDGDAMLACLHALGVTRLSAIVLTHFHADHVLGLDRVLARIPVGMVYLNPVREPADQARLVDQVLQRYQVPFSTVQPGDARGVGGVSWQVLWPRRVIAAGSVPNNASTVLLMRANGVGILLPGDIEPEAQVAVMAGARPLGVDVVKIPHHGSRYQHPDFAAWAGGRIALVSVGIGNDYGHPAPQTLQQWQESGALLGRTDLDGDLAVVRQGGELGLVTRGS